MWIDRLKAILFTTGDYIDLVLGNFVQEICHIIKDIQLTVCDLILQPDPANLL